MSKNEGSTSWKLVDGGRWFALVLLCGLVTCPCIAQTLKGCKTVFIQPMPESLDRFVSAELVKWGIMRIVTLEDKADCMAAFQRQASRLQVKSSGSVTVPKEASVTAEESSDKLPVSGGASQAALELVHRDSSVVVWAAAKSSHFGPMVLAQRLVDQLKKDYRKSQ
jgi:hypothetical protein